MLKDKLLVISDVCGNITILNLKNILDPVRNPVPVGVDFLVLPYREFLVAEISSYCLAKNGSYIPLLQMVDELQIGLAVQFSNEEHTSVYTFDFVGSWEFPNRYQWLVRVQPKSFPFPVPPYNNMMQIAASIG